MKSAGPTQDRRVRFSGAGSDGDSLLPGGLGADSRSFSSAPGEESRI